MPKFHANAKRIGRPLVSVHLYASPFALAFLPHLREIFLYQNLDNKNAEIDALTSAMKAKDTRKAELKELLRMAGIYKDSKPVYDELNSIKFKKKREAFTASHDSELRQFYMAQRKLKSYFNEKGQLPMSHWKAELANLEAENRAAYERQYIELHLKKTWYISFGTIMAAGINIVLNYIFVQRYGFVAAAYTTLFCYFVLMILHHFISRYVLKLHLYDDKFMYLSVVVTCIFGMIFMALYNKPWILRWILISVISLGYLWING